MSYFATFYSYKGGVGRTLALANVAWLLANHASEPARVLVIDFDLGAPGLFQVFGMRGAKHSRGIVDYFTRYLQRAEVPDIAQFIHKTAYTNIDIIPAGKMDSHYQRRLESIDWRVLYEGAFGYELVERLKSDISAIKPEYDYVLVDSLTGYTDVGGICVSQLPDLLILLFRLNQQNLDGIEKVYLNAIAARGEEARKSVIPVITPSWPFIDEAASHWIGETQKVFSEVKLLEISFDSSLSFGERIISKEASKLPLTSRLLEDYRRLVAQIRGSNPLDCLTIWHNIQRGGTRGLSDPADLYLTLLKRRPYVLEYWRGLLGHSYPWIKYGSERFSQGWEKLKAFADQESERGNKFALLARTVMHNDKNEDASRRKAIADLDRALQIDPTFSDALMERGRIAYFQHRYEDAARDFSMCLEFPDTMAHLPRLKIKEELAETYLRMYDGSRAILALRPVVEKGTSELSLSRSRSKALYLEGDYSAALGEARRYAKFETAGTSASLLPSQILAAMGDLDEAAKELEALYIKEHEGSDANFAEAYLAVDPTKTLALVKASSGISTPIRRLLIYLAQVLSGAQPEDAPSESHSPKSERFDRDRWSFFEIVAMLRAKERAGRLSARALQMAYDAIQRVADPAEFSLIQRSRANLTARSDLSPHDALGEEFGE